MNRISHLAINTHIGHFFGVVGRNLPFAWACTQKAPIKIFEYTNLLSESVICLDGHHNPLVLATTGTVNSTSNCSSKRVKAKTPNIHTQQPLPPKQSLRQNSHLWTNRWVKVGSGEKTKTGISSIFVASMQSRYARSILLLLYRLLAMYCAITYYKIVLYFFLNT